MVKIAVAGGAGNVAREIIDVLVATKKHDILVLTRRDIPSTIDPDSRVTYAKTDYMDVQSLSSILQGIHTVLSFIAPHLDQSEAFLAQKNLIDASVNSGVLRFAPSEWASAGLKHLSWYTFKADTRQYLADLNSQNKTLEYCLFQPGLFTNYLTRPYKSTKHVKQLESPIDFGSRRMLVPEDGDNSKITFTTVHDLANVVARAVEFEADWPVIGGIRGDDLSFNQLVALGEELRGTLDVKKLKTCELEAGTWSSSWVPQVDHPSIPPEHVEAASKTITSGLLLAMREGAFHSSDDWNRLLPDFRFENAEDFLREAWQDKP